MKRINENTIEFTQDEINDLAQFIELSLDSAWDNYTDIYCMQGITWRDGMRKMNPKMYEMVEDMETI